MPEMHSDRNPYRRIARNFEMLLTDEDRERFRAIVASVEADWFTTASAIFGMGLDAWEHQAAAALAEDNAAQAEREADNDAATN